MKSHLIDLFHFNEGANGKIIAKIADLPDQAEIIKLMSHLIHSQDKWLARLANDPNANKREWFGPSFPREMLDSELRRSIGGWVTYLAARSDDEVNANVQWEGFDGSMWEATLADIAMQLNFHSIHHRAQIQTMIRQQGFQPEFLDYIGTKYRRLE